MLMYLASTEYGQLKSVKSLIEWTHVRLGAAFEVAETWDVEGE
jgi:hypothetical protein